MEDLTGKQLGQYQIIAPLGEGGMAAVYKAYQLGKMNRIVALKILPQHLAEQLEFVKRFDREANVLAKLQHPRILPVFDFGESDGYTYLAMPFIESGTLADLLHGKPLPLPQIRSLTIQITEALDCAHSQGLVHRDVKPSNVLVDERGNCLLSDFGITKILEGTEKLTSTGGIVGTPAYMSPEQGRGETLDRRSDIYSLGVMLYEMATGRVPFRADTPLAVIIKHMQDPLPPPRTINPTLPDAVERVIFKALAKGGEDRYQSAAEMARAIQVAIPESTTALDQTRAAETVIEGWPGTIGEKKVKPKARLPKWTWAVSGLVLIVLVLGVAAVVMKAGVTTGATIHPTELLVPSKTAESAPTASAAAASNAASMPTSEPTRADTPTPSVLPTAAALSEFQLAFADSFDDDRYAWRPQTYAFGVTEITDGQFVLRPNWEDPSNTVLDTNTNYLFDEFDLVVRGTVAENPGDLFNTAYSIIFGSQGGNDHFELDWTPSGYYALLRLSNSQWDILIDWTFTGALEQGEGVENETHLTLEGGTLTIAFNGWEVVRKALSNYQPGFLGLGCSTYASPASVCAADVVIARWRQPQPVRVIAGCGCTQELYDGQEISIRLAWGATTRKRAQDFIAAATPRIWIDNVLLLGGRQEDLAPFWQEPVEDTPGVWAANWIYPFGELESGTHVLRLEFVLSESITDGFDSNNDGALDTYGPGTLDWGMTEIVVVAPPE
ncbi:MAG: serine/threonine-protein kinase [Anaerolineales bacterium]